MSTRHLGFFLCKNCGTLCILPLKSAKTYQNRAKNVKITRRSTAFEVFRRCFYAFTLRYASLDEQVVEAMEHCCSVGIYTAAEVTAYLIYRHGKDYALKRISKNAYYRNRDWAEKIGREYYGKYK